MTVTILVTLIALAPWAVQATVAKLDLATWAEQQQQIGS
jgi:hypothetical protein